ILAGASVRPTTASTPKRPWYKEMTDLMGAHAYTVLGTYKDKSGGDMVRIRNPHNIGWMPHGAEFTMPVEKFARLFSRVTYHDLPKVPPSDTLPGHLGEQVGVMDPADLSFQQQETVPVGHAIHDRALAEAAVRRLASDDPGGYAEIGMGSSGTDRWGPGGTWGLGRRADGSYVVLHSKGFEVDFPSDVTPVMETTRGGTQRPPEAVSLDALDSLQPGQRVPLWLLPDYKKVAQMVDRGVDSHSILHFYRHEGGAIAPGDAGSPRDRTFGSINSESAIQTVPSQPLLVGHDADGEPVYRTHIELRTVGGESLWSRDVYVSRAGHGIAPPPDLQPVVAPRAPRPDSGGDAVARREQAPPAEAEAAPVTDIPLLPPQVYG